MSLKIVSVSPSDSIEWDQIWRDCDYATYFHSREWAEIWYRYTKGRMRPSAKIIIFSDGKKAILSFSVKMLYGGLFKQYISAPAGTFGGWISIDDLEIGHAQLLWEFMFKKLKNIVLRQNPYEKLSSTMNIGKEKYDETLAINLKVGFDTIYKGWTKGHSSAARKARKAGVVIRQAGEKIDWDKYYSIYVASLKRWGEKATSYYQHSLFEDMHRLKSKNIKLWLAIYNDKIVAGALCFYAKRHVVYWHGAANSDYFNLRPVNLLIYEIIKKACESGYWWFDFNPSGGHEGVRAFKKSFGAQVLLAPVIIKQSQITRFSSAILKRIIEIIR